MHSVYDELSEEIVGYCSLSQKKCKHEDVFLSMVL